MQVHAHPALLLALLSGVAGAAEYHPPFPWPTPPRPAGSVDADTGLSGARLSVAATQRLIISDTEPWDCRVATAGCTEECAAPVQGLPLRERLLLRSGRGLRAVGNITQCLRSVPSRPVAAHPQLGPTPRRSLPSAARRSLPPPEATSAQALAARLRWAHQPRHVRE